MKKYMYRILSFLILSVGTSVQVLSQNLKQISHDEGLTNNAVFTLYQDKTGYIWVGSCDGLSIYYGQRIHPVVFPDGNSLEGYIVEQIISADDDLLWARTEHGLKCWSRTEGILRDFPQYIGTYKIKVSADGTILLQDVDGLYYYDEREESFKELLQDGHPFGEEAIDFGCTGDYLWRITSEGVFRHPWSKRTSDGGRLSEPSCLWQGRIISSVSSNKDIYLTESDGSFYHIDISSGRKAFLADLSSELLLRGLPSAVEEIYGDLFISFSTRGVLRLRRNSTGNFEQEDIGLKVGVFSMLKDRRQNVLWIATDGQGIYEYWEAPFSVISVEGRDVSPDFGSPVRALYVDEEDRLWIGTKGSGILVRDRSNGNVPPGGQKWITAGNSGLGSNLVYVFSKSSMGGLWIGTEEGLNFYNKRSRRITSVRGAESIRFVHAVEEVGDSILWIATVGEGIYKAYLSRSPSGPELSRLQHYMIGKGDLSSNFFFSMCRSVDGGLWFGNRGKGVYYLSSGGLEHMPMTSTARSQTVADVFSIVQGDDCLWVGTGNGLVSVAPSGVEKYYDTQSGLPNNTVHSLLVDCDGGIWISTNGGFARLDPKLQTIERFDRNKGLKVEEFSDGAAFLAEDGTVYFGGVNGWVEVRRNSSYAPVSGFTPEIRFTALAIKGERSNFFQSFGASYEDNPRLRLRSNEDTFTAEWVVFDNINYMDYSYQYRITPSRVDKWIDNGQSNMLTFTHMSPGDYSLEIKARNMSTGAETTPAHLDISIEAPWYAGTWARVGSALLLLAALSGVLYTIHRRARARQEYALEQMDRRHKEELYEEKLRFFTNVTHEFRTPLTLIYTPCERLLMYEGSDAYVKKYTKVIKANTDRLNVLIQEIIDYRKLESGHQNLHPKEVDVSNLTLGFFHSFLDVAEQNGMTMIEDIAPSIIWPTDSKCLGRILTNLITNALKYTKKHGTIKISLYRTDDDLLQLRVFNTGKGIAESDKNRVFNRYGILENVEENSVAGLTSRNGLGLSICKGLVELMGGTISVESAYGEYAEFIVRLPRLEIPAGEHSAGEQIQTEEVPPSALAAIKSELTGEQAYVIDRKGLPMILTVDDSQELLDLLRDSLTEYDVRTAADAEEALRILKNQRPEIVITDIMMPGTDGFSLTRQIKNNKHTMNIPMIILSARSTEEDRLLALDAGADAFIEKPFSINYLKAVISQMLKSAGRTREYYGSSASAFQYAEGKLLTTEDKELVRIIDAYLDENFKDEDLSVTSLAKAANLSSRALYRRFSSMGLPPPNEFIKDRRMRYASKMLLTSSMTIQEVIYECGFVNRAHFYKEFERRFGMTPKEYRQHNRFKDDSLS